MNKQQLWEKFKQYDNKSTKLSKYSDKFLAISRILRGIINSSFLFIFLSLSSYIPKDFGVPIKLWNNIYTLNMTDIYLISIGICAYGCYDLFRGFKGLSKEDGKFIKYNDNNFAFLDIEQTDRGEVI